MLSRFQKICLFTLVVLLVTWLSLDLIFDHFYPPIYHSNAKVSSDPVKVYTYDDIPKVNVNNPPAIFNISEFSKPQYGRPVVNVPVDLNIKQIITRVGWDAPDPNPKDEVTFTQMSDYERLTLSHFIKRMAYWDRPNVNKAPLPLKDKYISFQILGSGWNNRRMTLENAYVFAWLTGRTFVLPPRHTLYPFQERGYYEKFWDLNGFSSGVPTLTFEEFISLPNLNEIVDDVVTCKWEWSESARIFAYPKIPQESDEEWDDFIKFRRGRKDHSETYDSYTIPRFNDSKFLFIDSNLFNNFYSVFWVNKKTGRNQSDLLRAVRDHVHLKEEIVEYTARALASLPPCFSTMHFRRNDLNYESRKITPKDAMTNTEEFFHENEVIYVATDESDQAWKDEFYPVWSKRYTIVSWKNVSHLFKDGEIDPKWIPNIEQLICSQGRAFVGTRYSTMTNYINRLRGYSKTQKVPYYFFTTDPVTEQALNRDPSWSRESSAGYDEIQNDKKRNLLDEDDLTYGYPLDKLVWDRE